jgi:geranylgeranyl pyrophosphate synthase
MFAIRLEQKALTLYPFPADLINRSIREVLPEPNEAIGSLVDYLLAGSGKMLRPRLVFLSASLYPHEPQLVIDMAAAVELVHLASLVHDDVIDQSDCRRGRDSLNHCFGNLASVLTGDYLFATAFQLVNRHGQQAILNTLTSTIQTMCAGEIQQMQLAFDVEISEADYLQKSYRKTACLFAACCRIGALASVMPDAEAAALRNMDCVWAMPIRSLMICWISCPTATNWASPAAATCAKATSPCRSSACCGKTSQRRGCARRLTKKTFRMS